LGFTTYLSIRYKASDVPSLLPSFFPGTMSVRVLVASCPDLTGARIFALTHPRTGAAVQFVRAGDALLEVHRFRDGAIPRSWLLSGRMEMVLEDGSLLCAAARYATPRHATPRRATPRHAAPRHATPRHATPRLTPRHATNRRSDARTPLPRCLTDHAPLTMQARHALRPALPPPLTFGPRPLHAPRRRAVRTARCDAGAAGGELTRDTTAARLRVRRQGDWRRVLRAPERPQP
jgi:hypothetical protein